MEPSQRPKGVKHEKSFAKPNSVKKLRHSNTFAGKQEGSGLGRIAQSNSEGKQEGSGLSRIAQSNAEAKAKREQMKPGSGVTFGKTPSSSSRGEIGRTPSSSSSSSRGNIGRTSSSIMGRAPSSPLAARTQGHSLERTTISGSAGLVSRQDLDQIREVMSHLNAETDSVELRYLLLERLAADVSVEFKWWPLTHEMKTAVEECYRSELNARAADVSGDDPPPLLDVLTVMYREVLQMQRNNSKKLHDAYEFAVTYEGDTQINLSHSKETLAKLLRAWPGGTCNLQDFEAAFMYLPQQPTESQLRYHFFKLHDRLGDPGAQAFELSHEAFVEAYEELLYTQEGLRLTRLQELGRLFKYLDIRNMGYIRLSEIVNRFPAEEKALVSRQIETLLVYYDTDKNGKIDRHEFPNFYEGFLKLQNAYNQNDDRALQEDWTGQAESTVHRLLFSDVEFLASQFQAMDVKKRLSIPMSSVLFTLEGTDGGAPSQDELEHLRSLHQKSFSHGNMDLSEFVQIHKNFRDFRRKARKEEVQNNLEGDTSPFSRPLQRSKTEILTSAISGGNTEAKSIFFLRKNNKLEAVRPTRVQDALLKRPFERSKTEISAVVDLFRLSPDLKGVEGADLQKIAQGCGCGFFQAGQELFGEGEPSANYWLVITGSVIVSVRGVDKEALQVTEVRAGQGFGELGLIFEQPRRCAAAAARDGALLATVDRGLLFQVGLAQQLRAQRYVRLSQRLEVLTQLPCLSGRLDVQALFLLTHALRQRTYLPKAVIYERDEHAVEVRGQEELRAETLPGHKLFYLVQQGACEVWADSGEEGDDKELKLSNLVAGSCFGGFATGRRVTRVTAWAATAVQMCELRVDDALARIPREALLDLLQQQQRQDNFVQWRLAQLGSSSGVKSFLRTGGRPLSDLQTMLHPIPSGEFGDGLDDGDAASEVSSQAAGSGWVDEHVEKVVELVRSRTVPLKVKLSSKPETSSRQALLSDADVIRPLKSRWPIQNAFLLAHSKINTRRVLQKIRNANDPAVMRYHHPKRSRPPRAPSGHAHWMEEMEYPQPVAVQDPERQLDREAQQKISHAASLYELQFMDGHPVHIDVYSNLMQECALMGGKDETLDNIYTSVLYSDAMGMFLAARHEHEKDRSAAALRKHAASRISFALTPNYFFDILDQIAAKLRVPVPDHVLHLANELKELYRPTLSPVIPSGVPRPKTAPLPDKDQQDLSTMLSGAHSALNPLQRPTASLARQRPSSSLPAPSPAPLLDSAVAAHYSYLRADRTRSVARSLGQARLSLRSAGSIRTLQRGLYGSGADHPNLHVKKGPAHPATVSGALSHYPLLGPSQPELDSAPTSVGQTPLSATPSRTAGGRAPLRPNSCPPHKLRQSSGADDKHGWMAAVAERRDSRTCSRSPSASPARRRPAASAGPARKPRAGRTHDGVKVWQSNYEAEALAYDQGGAMRVDLHDCEESPMVAPVKFSTRAPSDTGPWHSSRPPSRSSGPEFSDPSPIPAIAIPVRIEHEPVLQPELERRW